MISLVGADPADDEGLNSDDNHGVSDVEGIQTHAEASTPEWSDVEQGQFPSPATTPRSDSEVELIGVREPPAPLWVLNLTLSEYVAWTRRGHVQSYAHSPFEQETNPNSIMWPTWWTIAADQLSDDEDGTIRVVDEVCMLRCTVTMVLFEDGIIRPVFVVWLLEKVSGRERMAALIREQSKPVIRPWPAEELSKAAPPKAKGWAKAKMPTAPTPKSTLGDAAYAYTHVEKASYLHLDTFQGPPILWSWRRRLHQKHFPKHPQQFPKQPQQFPRQSLKQVARFPNGVLQRPCGAYARRRA